MKIKTILLALLAVVMMSGVAMAEKEKAPLTVEGATFVSNEEAKKLFDDGVIFIDTREDAAWDLGRIPGAIHLDVLTDVFTKKALLKEVKIDEKVVFYCNGVNCGRSSAASERALEYGFTNVYYYREGYPGWKKLGYPTE